MTLSSPAARLSRFRERGDNRGRRDARTRSEWCSRVCQAFQIDEETSDHGDRQSDAKRRDRDEKVKIDLPCGSQSAVLVIAALIAFAVVGCANDTAPACPPRFDAPAWKRASGLAADQELVRRELAGQLERCGFIDGASKERVRRLLGAPIPEIERTRSWDYYIGEPAWGIDSDVLFIEFSGKNRVDAVEVGQS